MKQLILLLLLAACANSEVALPDPKEIKDIARVYLHEPNISMPVFRLEDTKSFAQHAGPNGEGMRSGAIIFLPETWNIWDDGYAIVAHEMSHWQDAIHGLPGNECKAYKTGAMYAYDHKMEFQYKDQLLSAFKYCQ